LIGQNTKSKYYYSAPIDQTYTIDVAQHIKMISSAINPLLLPQPSPEAK